MLMMFSIYMCTYSFKYLFKKALYHLTFKFIIIYHLSFKFIIIIFILQQLYLLCCFKIFINYIQFKGLFQRVFLVFIKLMMNMMKKHLEKNRKLLLTSL